ncbi:MAG: WecB/TagA/CpsF family glycosyltransferase [Myxococcota bacterium]
MDPVEEPIEPVGPALERNGDTQDRERKPERGARPAARGHRHLLGMRVDATDYLEATERILEMAETGGGMSCIANVHMVMEAWDDPGFRRVVNDAELVTPDGVPLVWSLRALGIPDASRVYGPDLTPVVCAEAERRGVPVGFLGGTPAVLETLCQELKQRFPALEIAFAHSPAWAPAPTAPDTELVQDIEDSGAQVLFVGLGCPKQERWMSVYRESLSCALVGVGAAFDFLAGEKAQAPAWLQRAGLEWAFRLACEPRRLWRRYLWHNPRFAWRISQQLRRARAEVSRA